MSVQDLKIKLPPIAEDVEFDNSTNGFDSDNTQDAIEEAKLTAQGFPRAGLALIQNGTSSNNDLISYSNLVSNTDIVFPVNSQVNEITIANDRNSVEFDLEIYKNGTAGGDLVTTLNISTGAGVRNQLFDLNANNITYNAGDYMKIIYKDQGTNSRDLVVVLWISRIV